MWVKPARMWSGNKTDEHFSFEGLCSHKHKNATKREEEERFNVLPRQDEVFHFLKGSVYHSSSCKVARKDYSAYDILICVAV